MRLSSRPISQAPGLPNDKRRLWPWLWVQVAIWLAYQSIVSPAMAADLPNTDRLTAELRRVIDTADSTTGVSVRHLETGTRVSVNGSQRFPLASTYKIPMAGLLLHRVDRGQANLLDTVSIDHEHRVVSSVIDRQLPHPGVSLSLANLVELMLTESDNTATDQLLEYVGGPKAVSDWLGEIGIEDLRVDRFTADILSDFAGLPERKPDESPSEQYKRLKSESGIAAFAQDGSGPAYARFVADPRDQGTPDAMTELLTRLWSGELLSPSSTAFLKEVMGRCRTGPDRLRGLLPPDTPVAHKTGTISGTVNDVGVVTLPGGRGHVVISVLIKQGVGDGAEHKRVIAEIARATYDFFVFALPPNSVSES